MQRIIIFGNSGAGKTTLANRLAEEHALAHLDLDTLAWQKIIPPTRKPIEESRAAIDNFIADNAQWVIEGCYADLLGIAAPHASRMIFLNPGEQACIDNCHARPWEPHKYESPEAQDQNLPMLIDWVRQYRWREDEFSLAAHHKLYEAFEGDKEEVTSL